MSKTINIFILIIFLFSCHTSIKKDEQEIIKIHVIYVSPLIETPINWNCYNIYNNTHYDTTIINRNDFFKELQFQIKSLKLDRHNINNSIDARICCKIYFSESDSISLSLGGYFGTMVNEKVMEDNLVINYLIKKNIGYYNLSFYDDLKFLKELKDTLKLKEIQSKIIHKRYRVKNINF